MAGTERKRRTAAEVIEEKKAKARAAAEKAAKYLADLEAGISQSSGNKKGRAANPAVAKFNEASEAFEKVINHTVANFTSYPDEAAAIAVLSQAASVHLGAVAEYMRAVGPNPTAGLLRWHGTEETKARFAKVAPAASTTPAATV